MTDDKESPISCYLCRGHGRIGRRHWNGDAWAPIHAGTPRTHWHDIRPCPVCQPRDSRFEDSVSEEIFEGWDDV